MLVPSTVYCEYWFIVNELWFELWRMLTDLNSLVVPRYTRIPNHVDVNPSLPMATRNVLHADRINKCLNLVILFFFFLLGIFCRIKSKHHSNRLPTWFSFHLGISSAHGAHNRAALCEVWCLVEIMNVERGLFTFGNARGQSEPRVILMSKAQQDQKGCVKSVSICLLLMLWLVDCVVQSQV